MLLQSESPCPTVQWCRGRVQAKGWAAPVARQVVATRLRQDTDSLDAALIFTSHHTLVMLDAEKRVLNHKGGCICPQSR